MRAFATFRDIFRDISYFWSKTQNFLLQKVEMSTKNRSPSPKTIFFVKFDEPGAHRGVDFLHHVPAGDGRHGQVVYLPLEVVAALLEEGGHLGRDIVVPVAVKCGVVFYGVVLYGVMVLPSRVLGSTKVSSRHMMVYGAGR